MRAHGGTRRSRTRAGRHPSVAAAAQPPASDGPCHRGGSLAVLASFAAGDGLAWLAAGGFDIGESARFDLSGDLAVLLLMLGTALAAPLVSYRRRDCLFVLVPLWGVMWYGRVVWRVAYLPYRDWAPRTDESVGDRGP